VFDLSALPLRTTALVGAIAVSILALPATSPVRAEDEHPTGRYGCRYHTTVPEGVRFDHLPRQGSATAFSPLVDALVGEMSFTYYDDVLRELSGEEPLSFGSEPITLTTRHSYSDQAPASWSYVFARLSALGYEVRFHSFSSGGRTLKNVVAVLPGEVTPEKIYVIGGHLDSISEQPSVLAPGAEDNASGSAAVMAAAAALAGYRFESTIELILFSGEEQGLRGSAAYVQEAISQGRDVQAAVTFDMISFHATDRGVLIEGEPAWEPLMVVMADAVDAYTTLTRQFSFFSFGSDHVPFQDAGIPAILCIDLDWDEYGPYHRSWDIYEETDPAFALEIATAGMATAAYLAGPLGPVVSVPDVVPGPPSLVLAPNPARGATVIGFAGPGGEPVDVFDVHGRRVRRLTTDAATSGTRRWNLRDDAGRPVAAGLYWVRRGDLGERLVVLR
jgi:hypothetical protein